MGPVVEPSIGHHELRGRAEVRRVGRFRMPVFVLVQDSSVVASMGRSGWLRTFVGPGQRVILADGDRWRLTSLGGGGAICPAILDEGKRRVAISTVTEGGYGINGKGYGLRLYAAENTGLSRANRWILRRHDEEIAVVTRHPAAIDATESVHVGAALLALTLVQFGIAGESRPRLKGGWV